MDILKRGYFLLAKNTSKYSDHPRVQVGAVIAKKKPISAASNKMGTHPKYANPEDSFRMSIHAEIRAVINSGCYDLSGGEIWIYRQHHDGKPGLSRPCEHCLSVLRERGIKTMYYSTEEFPYYRKEKI